VVVPVTVARRRPAISYRAATFRVTSGYMYGLGPAPAAGPGGRRRRWRVMLLGAPVTVTSRPLNRPVTSRPLNRVHDMTAQVIQMTLVRQGMRSL
jgi:hypothetical protein